MATKTPKKQRSYNVGGDTLLGKILGGMNTSMGEPIAPSGDRPGFTDIPGVDMGALQAQFAPGGYGVKSTIATDLLKNNEPAFSKFLDELSKQQEWDSVKNTYDSRVAGANALNSGQMTFPQIRGMFRDWWGNQPMLGKAAGAGLALGNIGGLMDNDKFGGQLGGLALGGLGSYMGGLGPGASALLTMGGGELGALFDKLRAKREGQRKQIAQQQQARR